MPDLFTIDPYETVLCPVKTHNKFDPTATLPDSLPLDEGTAGWFNAPDPRPSLREELRASLDVAWVDLTDHPRNDRAEATLAHMRAGVPVILGGQLPEDPHGHRSGAPALWVRGPDRDGRPGYHPVSIERHKVRRTRKRGEAHLSSFAHPAHADARRTPGTDLNGDRESDVVRLAHHHRMAEAAGVAADGPPMGALIGTDEPHALLWLDLSEPRFRTFSRSAPEGHTDRSALERYDHEHGWRIEVAAVARQQGADDAPAPLVTPIVVRDCQRCVWWEHCLPKMDRDDVSLRFQGSQLDVREIAVLRSRGIGTIHELAAVDLASFLPTYLPEVRHRSGGEDRILKAVKKAQMLRDGVLVERVDPSPVQMPTGTLDIDFDIETSSDHRVYLWGWWLDDHRRPPAYVPFADFRDLDDASELALARTALTTIAELVQEQQDLGGSVVIHHYSDYERTAIQTIIRRHPDDRALQTAAKTVLAACHDLLKPVQRHYLGAQGLGLKHAAPALAGFQWRDEDPSGLNSLAWFDEAVHDPDPQARADAQRRVLAYNEDDVKATWALRHAILEDDRQRAQARHS